MIRNIYQGTWSPFNCLSHVSWTLYLSGTYSYACDPLSTALFHISCILYLSGTYYTNQSSFSTALMHIFWVLKQLATKKNKTDLIRITSLHIFWVTYQPGTNYNNMGSFTYLFGIALFRNMIKSLSTWFKIFVIHFLVTVLRDIYKQCRNCARQVSQIFFHLHGYFATPK